MGMLSFVWIGIIVAQAETHLLVGDSHLMGAMGRELARLIIESSPSSSVAINASCGSTPKHFFEGLSSGCGNWQLISGLPVIDSAEKNKTVSLEKSLLLTRPDLVVVSMGTNLATECKSRYCYSDAEIRAQLNAFLAVIRKSQTKCAWIKIPPVVYRVGKSFISEKRAHAVNDLISEIASQDCALIESLPGESYPSTGTDGVHYSGDDARRWAQDIFKQIE